MLLTVFMETASRSKPASLQPPLVSQQGSAWLSRAEGSRQHRVLGAHRRCWRSAAHLERLTKLMSIRSVASAVTSGTSSSVSALPAQFACATP